MSCSRPSRSELTVNRAGRFQRPAFFPRAQSARLIDYLRGEVDSGIRESERQDWRVLVMKKSPAIKSAPAIEALRANLTGLLDTCPADQCNPPECPLFRVRKLGRAQRRRWFNALSEDDLKYLASYTERHK